MVTPTGAITIGNAQTEFGGAAPASLSEYYRGAAYVPAGTAAGTSGVQIATAGAIRLGDFRGVQKTAGTDGSYNLVPGLIDGYTDGYHSYGGIGSLTPSDYRGYTITQIGEYYFDDYDYNSFLAIASPTAGHPKNFFTSVTINGVMLEGLNATGFSTTTQSGQGYRSTWIWNRAILNLVVGSSYPVSMTLNEGPPTNLVAGIKSNVVGYHWYGASGGGCGSIDRNPPSDSGLNLLYFYDDTLNGRFFVNGSKYLANGTVATQSAFSKVVINGTITYFTSNATFGTSTENANWQWTGMAGLVNGGVYSLKFYR